MSFSHQCARVACIVLTFAACSSSVDKPAPGLSVSIDPFLTRQTVLGGDVAIAAVVTECSLIDEVIVSAKDIIILSVQNVQAVAVSFGGNEVRNTFALQIPASALPPNVFGIPVVAPMVLEINCAGKTARSEPWAITYLPTAVAVVPAFNPQIFWAATKPGDILGCQGTALVNYKNGITERRRVDLTFPCVVGDLRGQLGGRRYFGTRRGGLAAIDPGPVLVWTKTMDLAHWEGNATDDPMVLYDDDNGRHFVVFDRDTGATTVGPYDFNAVAGVVLTRPVRLANGDFLFLRSTRPKSLDTLTYSVQRLDSAGVEVSSIQVAYYPFRAISYVAEFSSNGEALYVTKATDADTRWLAKIDTTTGDVIWELKPEDEARIYIPMGEAQGRVLATSDEGFYWLSADKGDILTPRFGPASGKSFLRAVIEADQSVVMIADEQAVGAEGLYIFDPDGREVVAMRGGLFLRWLVNGWEGGPLLSNYDELHELRSRADYEALLQTPVE